MNPAVNSLLIMGLPVHEGKAPRLVIINRDMKWLCGVASISGRIWETQSGEMLFDPDHVLSDNEIVNIWLRDYCFDTDKIVSMDCKKMISLRQFDSEQPEIFSNIFIETPSDFNSPLMEEFFLFSSSYGGDGIRIWAYMSPKSKAIIERNDD